MLLPLHLVALVALATLAIPATVAECFYPNGKSSGSGLIPCNPNATISHCCRDSDMCLTNGLCFSFGLNAIVRRGCTDSTWNSSNCTDVCSKDPFRAADVVLTICDQYTTFCCGQNAAARNCCTTGNGTVQVIPGEPMGRYATTQSSPGPSCALNSSSATSKCKGCDPQRNAAIAVGAALGFATLVAAGAGALFFSQRRAAVAQAEAADRRYQELLRERQRFE